MKRCFLSIALAALAAGRSAHAQLAITETMSSESTNLGPALVAQGPDYWELSNFGTNAIDLTGYLFNDSDGIRGGDADSSTLSGVTIGPGESIVLVQSGTTVVTNRDGFIAWWGSANLPTNLQVLFYTGNGQSSAGDSIVLWSPTATSDSDWVDRADYGEAARGHSFTYNPTNGAFGTISSNGVGRAFKAVTADDEGSPGTNTGPVALAITQQPTPASLTVPISQDATFSVAAQGLPHPHYQWRFQGNPIDGAIRSTFTITNVQSTNAGLYSVVITNGLQSLTSSNATLAVTTAPLAPTFSSTPKAANAFIGQTVQFTAQASGSPTPAYQWQTNGVAIPGQNGPQLTLSNVQTNDAATYTVLAFSSAGTNSASAVLTVTPKPRLLITEVQSSEGAPTTGHADWWELTSFDSRPINLQGYRWDDNSHSLSPGSAYTITNDVTIHPGESVVFVENISPDAFRTWWGTNLPPGLQVVTYVGAGLGLSASADEVNLWNGATVIGNELTERIAGVSFAASPAGVTFVYDPEAPPLGGVLGTFSTNTLNGQVANGVIVAAQSGDIGSPGYVVGPVHVTGTVTSGKDFVISWDSVSNRTYTVLYTTDITAPNWSVLTNLTAASSASSATDSAKQTPRFYRVSTTVPLVSEP